MPKNSYNSRMEKKISLKNGPGSKEDTQTATRECRKMFYIMNHQRNTEIKTTMKYHLMPDRMAIAKNTRDNKLCKGCGETVFNIRTAIY